MKRRSLINFILLFGLTITIGLTPLSFAETEDGIINQSISGSLETLNGGGGSNVLTDGTWYEFAISGLGNFAEACAGRCIVSTGTPVSQADSPPWVFSCPADGCTLTYTDAFDQDDQVEVFDNGVSIGESSIPGSLQIPFGQCAPNNNDPEDCLADKDSSSGEFVLGPGDHSINFKLILSQGGAMYFKVVTGGFEDPEPEPEQITQIVCNLPESTDTEIVQTGQNLFFEAYTSCLVEVGDSIEEINNVKVTVDKNSEGLGQETPETEVDLSSWTVETYNGGNWQVQDGGFTVLQTTNTPHGTFFYSPFEAFNTQFTGQIKVETSGDDDYVGFALGFNPGATTNSTTEYLLIDWKQNDQGAFGAFAPKGLAVSKVSGIPSTTHLWGHQGTLTELARGTNLGNVGWSDHTTYEFQFVYTENNLQVFVNGVKEIDIDGEFPNGRVAFYNFSQERVRYSGFNVAPILEESGTVTLEFPFGLGTITITESGELVVDSEGPTYTINGIGNELQGTAFFSNLACEESTQEFVAVDNNDSVSGSVSLFGCSGEPGNIEPPKEDNNGGDNQWDTRPTFGISHETRQGLIVENGFSFNGDYFTVTDNHHTDFAEQSVEIGLMNSFTATVYADKQLKVQEFLFGIPNVGESHLAELGVEVWYDRDGLIEDVIVDQDTAVIDEGTISVSHEKTKCLSTDAEPLCDTTTVSMTFLEPLADKVMAIKAIDFKNRDQRTYLNDGFDISGDSLNPMLTQMIPSNMKNQGLMQVTQLAKYSPYWQSTDGRMFEMNSFGSFKEINQSFERFQDTGNAFTRLHSGFGGILDYEQNRATQVFDSTKLISDLPDSFGYHFEATERLNEQLLNEMLEQQEIAKKILEEMDKQTRHH